MMMFNGSFIVFRIYFLVGDTRLSFHSLTQCADFESEVHATLYAPLGLGECFAYRIGFLIVANGHTVGKPRPQCRLSLALIPTCVLSHTILIRAQCRNYQQGFSFVHL